MFLFIKYLTSRIFTILYIPIQKKKIMKLLHIFVTWRNAFYVTLCAVPCINYLREWLWGKSLKSIYFKYSILSTLHFTLFFCLSLHLSFCMFFFSCILFYISMCCFLPIDFFSYFFFRIVYIRTLYQFYLLPCNIAIYFIACIIRQSKGWRMR